jgi:EAL domain-containing protein (putative c-di-GMP-specific phosphodiesterase class I)
MPCTKCSEVFCLEDKKAKIYVISEFDELVDKTIQFLEKLTLKPIEHMGLFHVEINSAKVFFESNIDAFEATFSKMEQRDIKLYINYVNEPFNYQSILMAKPLQRYVNLVSDKEFFDIINNESLTSYFQPIVNAHDNSIYGYETLIRGVKPNGDLVFPDELFEKSARNDMNFKLDRLCRESSLKTAAVKKVHQKVFINFIPTSIYDPKFCLQSTVKWAKQLDFDPKNIVFEVVETENVEDKEHLKTVLKYYREQGYQVALDDVGEGYSSLNLLVELKPDIIKIDRKIISNIQDDKLKQSVYKALYTLAKENNITVLAEGIETPYELETIKTLGVDLMQGYYFCKPQAEPIRTLKR